MKTLKNKQTKIVIEIAKSATETDKTATYADLIGIVINNPGKEGFNLKEIKQRLKIVSDCGVVENGEFHLEDSDFNFIKPLILDFKWAKADQEIADFGDYIESIK